jgi:hypothetical protein
MGRLIVLSLLTLLIPFAAGSQGADDFSLNISLTRGERSRDSHSQTTRMTLKGRELLYEKSYSGYRGGARSVPVRKSFTLREEDLELLKKLVRDNDLLTTDALALAEAEGGIRRYFQIAMKINLDGKKSSIEVSGSREAADLKGKQVFQRANALLEAVYRILAGQDKEIAYENRDLIIDSQQ